MSLQSLFRLSTIQHLYRSSRLTSAYVGVRVQGVLQSHTIRKGLAVLIALRLLKSLSNLLSWYAMNNWSSVKPWNPKEELVVITGGSSGIGCQIVDDLVKLRVKVVILDIQAPKTELPTGAFFYRADITSRASLKAAADLIRVEHGDPTVLINNAGVGKDGTILEESEEDIRCTFEVNILSHFWTVKEFLPAMLKSNHGHVITIASVASFVAFGQAVDYCISKAGALAFHEALTQEIRGFYGSEKIRTSIIHPTWIRTPLIEPLIATGKFTQRVLEVTDVSKVVVKQIVNQSSGQVAIPASAQNLALLRALPIWLQEAGAHPIFGHTASQFKIPRGSDHLKFTTEIPNNGLIRLKGFFNTDEVLITSPKAIAEVLVAKPYDFPKTERDRGLLKLLIGEGLVVAEGNYHKIQRKHSLPSFAFRPIKMLYPLFWKKATKMTRMMARDAFGDLKATGVMDVEHWAPKATLDIIGVAGLGRDFNTLENSGDELVPLFEKHRLNQNPDDKSVDTLSLLIKSNVFSDSQLVDQLLTVLAAGHETTSSAFTWMTYLLAIHPDIQARLRAEIYDAIPRDIFDRPDSEMAAILESLPLLNGVCNETLRIYPTVPVVTRVSKNHNTILGQEIRPGTLVVMVPWAVNNDPGIWGPEASSFIPERWVDRTTGKPNHTGGADTNYAVMTFLHGPRSCIGQNFAKAELRCLAAAFVGAFEFEMMDKSEEVVPAGIITTKPRDGLKLKLKSVRPWVCSE
ncbi:hypothetical protein LTR84_011368 [Exophiala bonariae]|uniref:Short-chain dehydrogenase/reductase 3 n=1 Tax=Exophiala bonariae TaxID=1690606 RepID=A0AAV9MUI2_9EURO|nr:hypothetical protein LTR84_011368 [Exophiala bonariae]